LFASITAIVGSFVSEQNFGDSNKMLGVRKVMEADWVKIDQVNKHNKRLRVMVESMTELEYASFMKDRFEFSVSYEVVRERKMPTRDMISKMFDSVYIDTGHVLWGPRIFRPMPRWGRQANKDRMVDEMLSFWNQVGDVPFP
jgi:hypothetical protein